MRMTLIHSTQRILARALRRLRAEDGFTMVIALGVITVASMLVAATYVALNGDVYTTQHDLDGKRAYYAARAGENAFLYQLNQNPDYWATCANDYKPNPVSVPGATTGELYSYIPVYNAGYSSSTCTVGSAIAALIDGPTGTLRMEFTGYAGKPNSTGLPSVQRTIVVGFRKATPLDYLWYTDHEMKDPALDASCTNEKYYYQYASVSQAPCPIYWVTNDVINGPLYTNDQYLIYSNASPIFGRAGSDDTTESSAPKKYGVCAANNCQNAKFLGQGAVPGAQSVALPSSNSATTLQADAAANGVVIPGGTTTITLNGGMSTVYNCPGTTANAPCTTDPRYTWVNQPTPSIIYVQNGAGCPSTYVINTTYPVNSQGHYYGACGDVYITGTYSQPVTIVSDHDIVVLANDGSSTGITTSEDANGNPSGNAMLGLVAADFVRVMHGKNQPSNHITIDAAILTLSHSFMVDNWDSGSSNNPPKLTIHGAIAQRYRGAVGTTGGTGYLKDYHYDDRLHVLLPPYLFDIAISGWKVMRETLCNQAASSSDPTGCSYQG
jgi:hypothetical protein